ALLEKTDGLAGWVTIGGFSVLDFANVPNVSTTFIVYKNWSERGKGLTQDRIVSGLNRDLSGIQEAVAFVVIPPPIRGLGQTGGFQMMVEDRRSLALIQVRQVQGTELITRYNLYPAASIFGSAAPGFSSGQALTTMEQLAAQTLPEGMAYDWTSTSFQEKKVGYQAYLIYALSIVLVYMVLAALYESW